MRQGGFFATKSSTPRFITGKDSPWRFENSKYPIFRFATRVSTSPIAGSTYSFTLIGKQSVEGAAS